MTSPHTQLDFRFAPVPEELLYDTTMTPTAVRVWGLLARHGMDPTSCFPGHARIAEFLGLAVRSVSRPLRELEEAGWIERVQRFDERGARITDGYIVLTSRDPEARERALERAHRAQERGGSAQNRASEGADTSLPEREQVERDSSLSLALVRASERDVDVSWFDKFWSVYPRKHGIGAARKAFAKAVGGKKPDEERARMICNAAWRYANDPNQPDDKSKIPHASTWLNQERWEDEPLPPRSDGRAATRMQRNLAAAAAFIGDER